MWSSSSHIARGHGANTQASAARPISTEQHPNQHECAAPTTVSSAWRDSSEPQRPLHSWQPAADGEYKKFCAPTYPPMAQDHKKEGGTQLLPSQEVARQHPCQNLAEIGELRRQAQVQGVRCGRVQATSQGSSGEYSNTSRMPIRTEKHPKSAPNVLPHCRFVIV